MCWSPGARELHSPFDFREQPPATSGSWNGYPNLKDQQLQESSTAEQLRALTAGIVAAHVRNNEVNVAQLPSLIASVYRALAGAGSRSEPKAAPKPAVSIRSSVKPDHIVSLESGRKMKTLKRYLMTNYGMTADDYRRKWGLPNDYPMVARNYAEQRRVVAKEIGLGRRSREEVKAVTETNDLENEEPSRCAAETTTASQRVRDYVS